MVYNFKQKWKKTKLFLPKIRATFANNSIKWKSLFINEQ